MPDTLGKALSVMACTVTSLLRLVSPMVQNGELIMIDMADLTCGHPIYELGAMALSHINPMNPAITEQFTKMSAEHARMLWNLFLASYLDTNAPDVIERVTQKAIAVALLKMASLGAFTVKTVSREYFEVLIAPVRDNLILKADELITLLSEDSI